MHYPHCAIHRHTYLLINAQHLVAMTTSTFNAFQNAQLACYAMTYLVANDNVDYCCIR